VTAESESENVDLVAKKGAKTLGTKSGIDLGAGASQTVKLKVTGSGRNALEDLERAKVKVTGSVPFGAPDSAKRILR
jgi:hypothetical protein